MAKVIDEGWQTDLRDVATPTGRPMITRSGAATNVITLRRKA